jgi:hypothetical protein
MKLSCPSFFFVLLSFIVNKSNGQLQTFKIIKEFPRAFEGTIDTTEIKKLNEPLKSVTALYSAMAGTSCDTTTCELTSALGLGDQGSDMHKALIKKYFRDDKVAKTVITQDCTLSRDGSSNFSNYAYLTIIKSLDTLKVYYKVNFYDHGKYSIVKNHDVYIFRDNHFIMLRRKFWSWADK